MERGCLRDRVGEDDAGLGRDSLEDGLDTGGDVLSSGEDRLLLLGFVSGNLCATQWHPKYGAISLSSRTSGVDVNIWPIRDNSDSNFSLILRTSPMWKCLNPSSSETIACRCGDVVPERRCKDAVLLITFM